MKSKIKAKWIIKLPEGAEVLVKKGEVVSEGQLLSKVALKRVESFDYSLILKRLSLKKIGELNENLTGTKVEEGAIMCFSGPFLKNKICFPIGGNFLEIDEFGNLKIEVISGEEREILSPVRSIVSKVESRKIVLDFEAKEIKGMSLVEGKAWGRSNFSLISNIKELTSELKGRVVLTDNLDNSFLLKADVVGVVGMVTCLREKEDIDTSIPVLSVNEDDWKKLLSVGGDRVDQKVLLNSRLGRLLLVIE